VINVIFLADTEVTLRENKHLVDEGDADWTFGQTLALLLILVPLQDIIEALVKRRSKRLGKKLLEASGKGDLRVVEYVYNLGADPAMKDPSLLAAAKGDRVNVVKFLLEKNADVEAKNDNNQTPLMRATTEGRSDIVHILQAHINSHRQPY